MLNSEHTGDESYSPAIDPGTSVSKPAPPKEHTTSSDMDNIFKAFLKIHADTMGTFYKEQAKSDKEAREEQAERHRDLVNILTVHGNALNRLLGMSTVPVQSDMQPVQSTADFTTPIRRSQQQVVAQVLDQFTKEEYIKLSQSYKDICKTASFEEVLDMLGNGWNAEWRLFRRKNKPTGQNVVKGILKECHSKCPAAWKRMNDASVPEEVYQTVFGALCDAIQVHVNRMLGELHGVRWHDTQNTLIQRGDGRKRKPDGCFVANGLSGVDWRDMIFAVEIKGSSADSNCDVVRGQLLQDFIDMAEVLPRRFMVGMTLTRGAEIQLYACVPGGIYNAPLGSLNWTDAQLTGSSKAEPTAGQLNVVRFLLFLHQQLAQDCGYLTGYNTGFPCDFLLEDLVSFLFDEHSKLCPTTTIRLNYMRTGDITVLGRHKYLRGQRTWVYPAQYRDETCEEYTDAFFKFQWAFASELETDVHQYVLERGVPHIPKLLYTASIEGKGAASKNAQKYKGEAIVMENVGKGVQTVFVKNDVSMSDAEVIDMFAGYVHTLFAAAEPHKGKFALHRDISMGNLMVGHSGEPYIIDWGCGRVCTVNEKVDSAGKEMIGTAIYMGIRILARCTSRSVIDDLESLFLVLCHCIWRQYGNRDSDHYHSLWSNKTLHVVRYSRMAWLASNENLINFMGFSSDQPSEALCSLMKGIRELLFPSAHPIYSFNTAGNDPRLELFDWSAWLQVFETAADLAKNGSQAPMPYLHKLHTYVNTDPDRRYSSIFEMVVEPSDNDRVNSQGSDHDMLSRADNIEPDPESPTPGISKKRPGSSTDNSTKKPRH
ncbi:hypothetical protein FB645_000566 [Coemansia sp. IMI 203386]|nr:hypothetical protein FB645_000566 [Coemansia sp. IMI 203386]